MKQQRTSVNDFDETAKFKSMYELQGVDFSKLRSESKSIADEWKTEILTEVRGKKRKRTSRVVMVDGHTVLKQNMYSLEVRCHSLCCFYFSIFFLLMLISSFRLSLLNSSYTRVLLLLQEGEPSVYAREAAKSGGGDQGGAGGESGERAASMGGSGALSARQLAGRDYENSPVCGVCWEGGKLLCCDFCPSSFHMECIGLEPDDFGSGAWSCPHHACATCNMKATAAGGLLFRCEMCSNAFCEGAFCFVVWCVCCVVPRPRLTAPPPRAFVVNWSALSLSLSLSLSLAFSRGQTTCLVSTSS